MASLALILSNVSTVKTTIKWTVINVLIDKTVSTKSSIVENNRISLVEYSNVAILFSIVFYFFFLFFFSIYMLFAHQCYLVVIIDCHCFFLKIQQFITWNVRANYGSYFITIYKTCKLHEERNRKMKRN